MPIAMKEQLSRERWIEYVRSSSAIEGLKPDAETQRIEEAYVRGDLSETEFSDELAKLAGVPPCDHQAIDDLKAAFARGEMSPDVFMARFSELLGPR